MTGNQDQVDFWSSDPGLKWIRFEEELNVIFENVNTELIRRVAPVPGEHVLDIGCGTGATTRAFASQLAPGGSVTAIDISEPLLAHASSRATDVAAHTGYHRLDAQQDTIPGAPFDIVTSRFGVMFFSDPAKAFINIRKQLRTGGRLVVAAWAPIDFNPWFKVPQDGAVARLGPPDSTDPHAPGPLGFQDVNRVTKILESAGFQDVTGETTEVVLAHPGPLERVSALASNIGPAARVLKKYSGDENDIAAIEAFVHTRFGPFATPQGIRIPARLNFFSAANPK